eukprot:jgi/Astpho2/1103/e_gw1.00020.53.1_t
MGQDTTASGTQQWSGFEKFTQTQELLERNKLLINQIDSNHKERKPEGLACNVMLIRELNNNIQTVIKLYQDLSAAVESIGTPEH